MEKTKIENEYGYYETVTPFDGVTPGADGLFDDCPHCQKLREQMKEGTASPVPKWIFRNAGFAAEVYYTE